MELPKYHLRITSDNEASVFRIRLNDQRRIRWERCARLSLPEGKITMLEGQALPSDLGGFCKAALATLQAARAEDGTAYMALKAMGQLAEAASSLEQPMATDLFDMLIWSEADLKSGLVANKGLAMMAGDDQEKYLLQGQQYMDEGKYALAEAAFLHAVKLRANRASANNFLAIAYEKQGKHQEAAAAINECLKGKTSNVGHMLRGVQYNLAIGGLKTAQGYIEELSKAKALPAAQLLQVSRFAMRAEMGETGIKLAQKLVDNGEGGEAALEHLVNIVAADGGEKPVFEIMRRHAKKMPETPRLKAWYLRMLIADDRLEAAEKVAKNWVKAEEDVVEGHFQLGRTYLAMHKPRRALRALNRVVELAPDNGACHKLIADACLALNDLEAAATASEKACRLQPDNPNFINQSKRITEALMQKSGD